MRISFPPDLPISQRREEIARAIAAHQVVIVCGETGSGKTTQLPKICLEVTGNSKAAKQQSSKSERVPRGFPMIGCTQPRRIAARSVASRLAFELGEPLGGAEGAVGFKVRFTDRTSPATRVKVMTDGILLAETQQDRMLRAYDTIIIDEAHERSVNIDFLLGYLKRLLPRRPDLKVIVTSATIDPETFSRHFDGAPVVEVSGRTYPVEVRYRPVGGEEGEDEAGERVSAALGGAGGDDRELYRAIVEGVEEVCRDGPGDVLVFLPGEREIREAHKALRGVRASRLGEPTYPEILPLYARLSSAEQDRVFSRGRGRRIVLATNVAETSLTVPGIRSVVDTGLARISRYSARAKVQRLPIEPISQASANQRKGRCGREGPGVCVRLYSREDFESREAFTPPEIQRSNLAGVILQMKSLRLGGIGDFPFIDPPKGGMIRDGLTTLHEIGALDEGEELTEVGRRLSRLPVDPRIGRMILAGGDEGCLEEVLVIGAALSIQDPRLRPGERRDAADAAHEKWIDERSDFLSFLNLWTWFHELSAKLGRSRLRKACEENYLAHPRMREWGEVYRQLKTLAKEAGVRPGGGGRGERERANWDNAKPGGHDDAYERIHRALLTGLLANVAVKREGHEYEGTRNSRLYIHPGSGQFSRTPKWIVAGEIVETTRRFARLVAQIDPAWIEPLAGHLVKRSYAEPRFNPRAGRVEALERVTLLGLEIVSGRRANYGPVDPAVSRELFIREGLVEGAVRTNGRFVKHNADLMRQVEQMQARGRRRDLLADEQRRHAFFDERLPPDVYDTHRFERWRKQAERERPRILYMGVGDVLEKEPEEDAGRFPEAIRMNGESFPLTYRFEPGEPDDGVTVAVPIDRLGKLDEARLEWLVPGLLQEKVIGLIRSLPGRLRGSFAPAPDHARAVAEHVRFGEGDLLIVTARLLARRTGVAVSERDFDVEALPAHLRMNVRAVDKDGKTVAESRDPREVKRLVRERVGGAALAAAAADDGFTKRGLREWSFGALPGSVQVQREGVTVEAYPAIVDEGAGGGRGGRGGRGGSGGGGGGSVAVTLVGTKAEAARLMRLGLRRLFAIAAAGELRFQIEHLPGIDGLRLAYATVGSATALAQDLEAMTIDAAFRPEQGEIRTAGEFEARLTEGWGRIGEAALASAREAGEILEAHQRVMLELERPRGGGCEPALEDVAGQVERLVHAGFLAQTPARWRRHIARYLHAAAERLARLTAQTAAQDAALQEQVQPFWQAAQLCVDAGEDLRADPAEVETFRWMVEEFRVSLFAQRLGTSMPISAQRLRKQWEKVRG